MQLHNVQQGSQEWAALRTQYFTASEAPAMMGASSYMTRQELLAQKHTGLVREVDAATQRRFDAGHATEAAFRPVAEEIIGDELFPCTGSIEIDGLRLLASFDGLTMDRKIGFEHKLYHSDLADAIAEKGEPGPAYYWQLEQQLLVSGAEKILFVFSDGTKERNVTCWYESRPERRASLIAGWKQFAEDLKAYVPPASAPVVVAEPVQALPAVLVQVSGEIVVKDNFKTFETALRDFLDHRLIREPKTDQDFADLEVQIKAMKGAEEALAGAEAQMLAQVQSIDSAKKTKDMLGKLVRDNRLMAEKLLASEKERRRSEIVAGGIAAFHAHIDALNKRLGKAYMPLIQADFGGVIKGLKSLASMEDKVATELARVKIEASQIADKIEFNLKWLRDVASEYGYLFNDAGQLVQKNPDDFKAVAENRISTEKARQQAEHDRIREEAAARERQRLIDEQAAAKTVIVVPPTSTMAEELAKPTPNTENVPLISGEIGVVDCGYRIVADAGARIRLGEINARIAPLSITADGLAELGFPHVATDKAAKLYRESDWPAICEELIQHITQVADLRPA